MSAATRLGAGALVVLIAMAVLAPWLAPYDPAERVGVPFSSPSQAHPLGTDDAGRDLLSAFFLGARTTLLVGGTAAAAATGIGAVVGLLAGYRRGALDIALMRLVDVLLALPLIPLVIVLGVFIGPGTSTQVGVIAAVLWGGIARELRAQVLSAREREHVRSAVAMGARTPRVLARHLAPQVLPLMVPQFVLATKTAILVESSLAFLGLGDVASRSWGTTLFFAHSRSAFLTDAWLWWVLPPGIGIAATVLAVALVGFGLERRGRAQLGGPAGSRRGRARPRSTQLRRARRGELGGGSGEETGEATDTHGLEPRLATKDDGAARPALEIAGVSVAYPGEATATLHEVDLTVPAGSIMGLVGRSGSGKTTLARAVTGMLPAHAAISGQVAIAGHELPAQAREELAGLAGTRVAVIPQDAMSALNPVHRIGAQLAEAMTVHGTYSKAAAHTRARELLALVDIDPGRDRDYPHQLSGGMRQRVLIAMALANAPDLIIADEPTTGLDTVTQAEIVELLARLPVERGLGMLLISHDLVVITRLADRVAVLEDGRLTEHRDPGALTGGALTGGAAVGAPAAGALPRGASAGAAPPGRAVASALPASQRSPR